jgi:hypothetical protein
MKKEGPLSCFIWPPPVWSFSTNEPVKHVFYSVILYVIDTSDNREGHDNIIECLRGELFSI